MKHGIRGVSALLSLALAATLGSAAAAESATKNTTIRFIHPDSGTETLKFEGELAIGDSRGLYTDAGTPVTVRRTETGLSIDSKGKVVDVPYPDAEGMLVTHDEDVHIDGEGHKRHVIVMRGKEGADGEATAANQQHVIVLKDAEHADLDWVEASVDAAKDGREVIIDEADGQRKVIVIRRKTLTQDEAGVSE